MKTNGALIFSDLFDRSEHSDIVEIPIIQRDYAQGRSSAGEIRTQFLKTLYHALSLPVDSPELPLNLDFIYGTRENSAFCPLDGQQRLTTLFLLHWYLACKDIQSDEFKELIQRDEKSRFTYRVRRSSEEFFNALVACSLRLDHLLPEDVDSDGMNVQNSLSKTLSDSSWFYLSWRLDPTIQSALTVLDSIHTLFYELPSGGYQRLVNKEQPCITFQFLDLNQYGLTDDLYIKMNARGKPLTPFETFKASLEQKIGEEYSGECVYFGEKDWPVSEYFSHRVDTTWSDLFWKYRDAKTNLFDKQFMSFIRGMVLITYPQKSEGTNDLRIERVMELLQDPSKFFTFYTYQELGCLSKEFIAVLIKVLDGLTAGLANGPKTYLKKVSYYNEEAILERVLYGRCSQSDWVQFCGYCAYLTTHTPTTDDDNFDDWMRVVTNLSNNTIYSHTTEFRRALCGVRDCLTEMGTRPVLDYISETPQWVKGFNLQQVREEKLKAQLIKRMPSWRQCIMEAEQHGYFKGQIEFLLDFSGVLNQWVNRGNCDWDQGTDKDFRNSFIEYYTKANAIFNSSGLLKFRDFLWERSLLTLGDYLLKSGPNQSFLKNSDKTASWKRLLRGSGNPGEEVEVADKRTLLKMLLDLIDSSNVEKSLQEVIEHYMVDGARTPGENWLRKLVECPGAIEYCSERQIREVSGGNYYLLTKVRTSSHHGDLSTYHLMECVIKKMHKKGLLGPFLLPRYIDVVTDSEQPEIILSTTIGIGLSLAHDFSSNGAQWRYRTKLFSGENRILGRMESKLKEMYFTKTEGAIEYISFVNEDSIEMVLGQLASNIESLNTAGAK